MNSHEVFIHIHQGCVAGTGAIVRLPQCQWSKPDGYGKISQYITTTKHSKAKTVCIFLGIYCSYSRPLPCGESVSTAGIWCFASHGNWNPGWHIWWWHVILYLEWTVSYINKYIYGIMSISNLPWLPVGWIILKLFCTFSGIAAALTTTAPM